MGEVWLVSAWQVFVDLLYPCQGGMIVGCPSVKRLFGPIIPGFLRVFGLAIQPLRGCFVEHYAGLSVQNFLSL